VLSVSTQCNGADQALWLLQPLIAEIRRVVVEAPGFIATASATARQISCLATGRPPVALGDWNDIAPVFRCPPTEKMLLLHIRSARRRSVTRSNRLVPPIWAFCHNSESYAARSARSVLSAMQGSGSLCGSCQRHRVTPFGKGNFRLLAESGHGLCSSNKMLRGLHLRLGPLWPSFAGRPGRCQWRRGHGRTLSVLG